MIYITDPSDRRFQDDLEAMSYKVMHCDPGGSLLIDNHSRPDTLQSEVLMPRASSICLTARCLKVAIRRSRCDTHDPGPWAGSVRNAQRPSNWPTLRRQARTRDGRACRLCGSLGAFYVDHIIPVARGGSWKLENLQTLCETCHGIKTKHESKEGRHGG